MLTRQNCSIAACIMAEKRCSISIPINLCIPVCPLGHSIIKLNKAPGRMARKIKHKLYNASTINCVEGACPFDNSTATHPVDTGLSPSQPSSVQLTAGTTLCILC